MDPRLVLMGMREYAAEILAAIDVLADDETGELEADVARKVAGWAYQLAEHVQALDTWRRSGGFDPWDVERGP